MFIVAFIKNTDVKHLQGTPVSNHKTSGIMGVVGNKGGVMIQF